MNFYVVLDFKGFELILDMDWLSIGAILGCRERTVTLVTQLGNIAKIPCEDLGINMCSFLHTLEASQEWLGSIEVVKNFRDVFEEVMNLPHVGRWNFTLIQFQCKTHSPT